ncbi:MAG TPA: hypothetical protein VH518_10795, partial [Tepidisphaeraceae bacterium]
MMASFGVIFLFLLILLIVGAALLGMGLRGSPVFTSPRCARCNYDLRAMNFMSGQIGSCPECGADLSAPRAVTFGRLQSRRGLVGLGATLMTLSLLAAVLIPFAVRATRSGGAATVAIGPAASSARTTPALLASLPATINQPWDWQELERRLGNNTLTTADVDAAFNVLIADLNAKRAAGQYVGALPWVDGFLKLAIQTKTVSPPVLMKLNRSFYGQGPEIRTRPRWRQGQPIDVDLELRQPWNLPGSQFVWALRDVKADDGSTLAPTSRYNEKAPTAANPDQFSGANQGNSDSSAKLTQNLSPGDHELTFTFDLGAVPERSTFRGLDGRPGTADKWPNPTTTWQTTVTRKVTIVPADQPVIDVITDPQQDPLKLGVKITVEQALVRPSSRGVEIVIKFKVDGSADPALAYHTSLLAGGQKIDFGSLMSARTRYGSTSGMNDTHVVKSLPADVKSIDILFTPDPKVAEGTVGVEKMWGGEYKIESVPLERFDLT